MRSETREQANENKKIRMVLPFQPLSITFDDIRYSVDMAPEMKAKGVTEDIPEPVKGVSGAFRPGVLTAVMGVRGAGKTTLIDVLAGRKTGGYMAGDIRISGYPKNQETFTRVSGYCDKAYIHSPNLTVIETLMFSSWLRLPSDVDEATRRMFVEEMMELVELDTLRYAPVGIPGVNGLSTDQRKRLTIAVELVANPSVIFMDEPISGLDARASAIVMRTVRNTVNTGRTVVCTIHQPSIDNFYAFDELLLLKRGGQQIYFGPIGDGVQLIEYFEAITGVHKIKEACNPATWMLEVTSVTQEAELRVDFAQIYKNSNLYRRTKALITELSIPAPESKDLYFPTQYSQSSFVQFMACLWKVHCSYWRNSYTTKRLSLATFHGVMFGSRFWMIGNQWDTQETLLDAMGSMFSAGLMLGIPNSLAVQNVLFDERKTFYRERAAGMYSALPYAFAQVFIEIPYTFLQTIIYGVIVYSMMGFDWTAAKYLEFILFIYITLLYFTYYGMMCASLTPIGGLSAIVSFASYGILNLFTGFLIPRPSMPQSWSWYYWTCPVVWSLYGVFVSQFGGDTNTLTSVEGNLDVKDFLQSYFGFRLNFLGPVAGVILGINVLLVVVFAYSIKTFNFREDDE